MLIDEIRGSRVLVVGDVMLDHFVNGSVERVSPEAPALVLQVQDEGSMLGGAGNVAANIASLGGVAVLVGVVGNDLAADHLASLVASFRGALVDSMVRLDESRTTQKTRYISGDRHLLRADSESVGLSRAAEEVVSDVVRERMVGCDAVVVSDYAKGVVSSTVMEATVAAAEVEGIPVVADPKRRDFVLYSGADLLTPNVKELEFATGESCLDLDSCQLAAREVMAVTGAAVLLTRSEAGVALFTDDGEVTSEPGQTQVVRDVSGAGDTVAAVCAIALASGAELKEAAHLANVAAAVAVGKHGTSSVTPDELNLALLHSPDEETLAGKLVSISSARSVSQVWQAQGLSVGFANGCFDLLHPGHVQLLAEARARCDRLVVALNSDASVLRLKGEGRPVQTELARAEVIGALRSVDLVVIFGEDNPLELIRELRPDVLIKGADYTLETVVGADLVLGWSGRVELIELVPNQSSTRLISSTQGPTL